LGKSNGGGFGEEKDKFDDERGLIIDYNLYLNSLTTSIPFI
jgi:hypothetical protein